MDSTTANEYIKRKRKENSILISFFGDSSYNWIKHDKLVEFGPFYDDYS